MGDSKYSEWRYAYLFMAVDDLVCAFFCPLVRAVQFSLSILPRAMWPGPTLWACRIPPLDSTLVGGIQ